MVPMILLTSCHVVFFSPSREDPQSREWGGQYKSIHDWRLFCCKYLGSWGKRFTWLVFIHEARYFNMLQ